MIATHAFGDALYCLSICPECGRTQEKKIQTYFGKKGREFVASKGLPELPKFTHDELCDCGDDD